MISMNVSILYFASLREAVGLAYEQLELPGNIHTISNLLSFLAERGDSWSRALDLSKGLRCAVNQEVVGTDEPLIDGAEVAFFPPVTGG